MKWKKKLGSRGIRRTLSIKRWTDSFWEESLTWSLNLNRRLGGWRRGYIFICLISKITSKQCENCLWRSEEPKHEKLKIVWKWNILFFFLNPHPILYWPAQTACSSVPHSLCGRVTCPACPSNARGAHSQQVASKVTIHLKCKCWLLNI